MWECWNVSAVKHGRFAEARKVCRGLAHFVSRCSVADYSINQVFHLLSTVCQCKMEHLRRAEAATRDADAVVLAFRTFVVYLTSGPPYLIWLGIHSSDWNLWLERLIKYHLWKSQFTCYPIERYIDIWIPISATNLYGDKLLISVTYLKDTIQYCKKRTFSHPGASPHSKIAPYVIW